MNKDETRYHPFHAHFHAWWRFPNAANWYPEDLLLQGITATMKGRLESISETSVSFHLVKRTSIHVAPETNFSDRGMRRYHAILFGLCPNQSIADVNPFKNSNDWKEGCTHWSFLILNFVEARLLPLCQERRIMSANNDQQKF
jgi:hypothetical protein